MTEILELKEGAAETGAFPSGTLDAAFPSRSAGAREPGTLPVGARLASARAAAGLSRQRAASAAEIDVAYLSRIERGLRTPSLQVVSALARAYGLPVGEVLGGGPPATASVDDARLSAGLGVSDFVASTLRRHRSANGSDWLARPDLRASALWFAQRVFEPVRALLGVPLEVVSGYRTPALDRHFVKDRATYSAHVLGLAADVVPAGITVTAGFERIREALADGRLPEVDLACLGEGRWIHLQAAPPGQPARRLATTDSPCSGPVP
jgi:transcriptional regulator with XRE-family HTH domain